MAVAAAEAVVVAFVFPAATDAALPLASAAADAAALALMFEPAFAVDDAAAMALSFVETLDAAAAAAVPLVAELSCPAAWAAEEPSAFAAAAAVVEASPLAAASAALAAVAGVFRPLAAAVADAVPEPTGRIVTSGNVLVFGPHCSSLAHDPGADPKTTDPPMILWPAVRDGSAWNTTVTVSPGNQLNENWLGSAVSSDMFCDDATHSKPVPPPVTVHLSDP